MVSILIALGILVALAVVVFAVLVALKALPEHMRSLIKEFQTLIGGCIALTVAGIAFGGVWFSTAVQSENTRKQIEAARAQLTQDVQERRDGERRAFERERSQLGAAFASEITVIAQIFSGANMLESNDKSIAAIKESLDAQSKGSAITRIGGPPSMAFNKPRSDYALIYRANAGRIGLFPSPLAEEIVRFYGTYIQLEENLKTLDQAAKEHFEHMGMRNVEDALKGQNIDLKGLQIIKDDLVPRLQALSAETTLSLPQGAGDQKMGKTQP